MPVTTAIKAKVGAAASDSQSARCNGSSLLITSIIVLSAGCTGFASFTSGLGVAGGGSHRRCRDRRRRLVAVVVAHPRHRPVALVATLGCEIEQGVGAHHGFHTAPVG